MKDYSYISQLTTTLIFLCMCRLVLVDSFYKRTGIIFYLYIAVCCLIIAPFSGQLGTPLLLIGSSLILFLISKDSRIINLLLFQLLWFWSVLTDYVITIPLSLLDYSFAELRTSFLLNMVFSILHALLCILPCLFIGNRLHRKLVTDQNVIPPRILFLYFPDQHHFRQSASLSERYSVLQRNPDFLLRNSKRPDFSDALQHTSGQQKAGASGP